MTATISESPIEDLRQERARLRAQVNRREQPAQEPLGHGYDPIDFATNAEEQVKNAVLQRHTKQLLEQVEYALTCVSKGFYGLCEDCGQRIDTARLAALPYATRCLSCQQRREHRHWRNGGGL